LFLITSQCGKAASLRWFPRHAAGLRLAKFKKYPRNSIPTGALRLLFAVFSYSNRCLNPFIYATQYDVVRRWWRVAETAVGRFLKNRGHGFGSGIGLTLMLFSYDVMRRWWRVVVRRLVRGGGGQFAADETSLGPSTMQDGRTSKHQQTTKIHVTTTKNI